MKYGRKVLPISHAKAIDGLEGVVEAYVSVFHNTDFAGEVVMPGFFAETIADAQAGRKQLPTILWSHDTWSIPLGITKEAQEVLPYDARLPDSIKTLGGLRVVGEFNLQVQSAREAFSSIVFGSLREYSIGYYVLEDSFDRETGVIRLVRGDWKEWSPVNFAANDMTLTVGAKNIGGRKVDITEHVYVIREPSDFADGSFRRDIKEHEESGRTYTIVTGKLRATDGTLEASVRFDADAWSVEDAKQMCSDRGNHNGTFYPATTVAVKSSDDDYPQRVADHGARVVAQVSDYLSRVTTVKDLRLREGKVGREISGTNRTVLESLIPPLEDVAARIKQLLADSDPAKVASNSQEVKRLYAQMQSIQIEMLGADYAEVTS